MFALAICINIRILDFHISSHLAIVLIGNRFLIKNYYNHLSGGNPKEQLQKTINVSADLSSPVQEGFLCVFCGSRLARTEREAEPKSARGEGKVR
jgi:hypothetical protein